MTLSNLTVSVNKIRIKASQSNPKGFLTPAPYRLARMPARRLSRRHSLNFAWVHVISLATCSMQPAGGKTDCVQVDAAT